MLSIPLSILLGAKFPAMTEKTALCTFDVKSDNHMWRLSGVLFLAGILFLIACKTETSYEANQLTGHWAVYGAERNGKNTTLLNGAIFQFMEDGSMNTNITGQEVSGRFDLQENKISFEGGEKMLFEIGTLHGDTLSLNTELQGMHFILDLHRTNTESQ